MVRNALQERETTSLILTFTIDELLQWSEMLFMKGEKTSLIRSRALAIVRNALHERGENLTDTSLYCR